jgi:hypothetical protein
MVNAKAVEAGTCSGSDFLLSHAVIDNAMKKGKSVSILKRFL